jgi:tetratricopeptide (TPR) repeat protein
LPARGGSGARSRGPRRRVGALGAWLGLFWLAELALGLGCQAAWACGDHDPVLVQADACFAQRRDLTLAERAADLFRRALNQDHHCRTAALGLARISVFIGVLSSGDKEQRAYQEAAWAAGLLVEGWPRQVEGHYWLGVAQALQANAGGFLLAVRKVRAAKASLARALELDPTYDQGGPHRVLGRLHYKLPAILGGDYALAERHLRLALELGPRNWLTHIYLAVLLRDQGRADEAKDLLGEVMAGPAQAGHEAEYDIWREQARRLSHDFPAH